MRESSRSAATGQCRKGWSKRDNLRPLNRRSEQPPLLSHPGDAASLGAVVGAMGIVFGDIATSPLYTLQECLAGPHGVTPVPANVLGCVSLIVWSLLLVVTVKYVGVLMQADNRGEGGIIALLALVPRSLRERRRRARHDDRVRADRCGAAVRRRDHHAGDQRAQRRRGPCASSRRGSNRRSCRDRASSWSALFSIQSRGSGGLGRYFGPVMALWLGTALVLGVIQIVQRPEVLAALSPHHGIEFLLREKFAAFRALGGVVLSVTGGEALYADMGHFGRRPIRIGWLTFALPALVLNYLGQGALLLGNSDAPGSRSTRWCPLERQVSRSCCSGRRRR